MFVQRVSKLHIEVCTALLFLSVLYLIIYFPTSHITDSQSPLQSKYSWLENDFSVVDIEYINTLNQKDPKLLNYLKLRHLTKPSKLPYNFNGKFTKSAGEDGSIVNAVKTIFKNATGGFFVECGAYDGIYSNTLFLERDFQWEGLLIECNPILVTELIKTHRKAYLADVCVSVTENPESINITSMDNWPASSSVGEGDVFPHHIQSNFTNFEVQAFPFYSIIAATGVKVVDFITLDVQSIELKVVKTFPFGLILVKVWVVEIQLLNGTEREELNDVMSRNGYRKQIISDVDLMFIHNSIN